MYDAPPTDGPGEIAHSSTQRLGPERLHEVLLSSLGKLQRLARSLTPSDDAAADLVQATCLRALERLPDVRDDSNIPGWLSRVMRNLQIDGTRAPAGRTIALEEDKVVHAADPMPMWRRVADEDVARFLGDLAPQLRSVWELHGVEGMDQSAIAERLGIPRSTVATRVFRARAAMRTRLLSAYGEGP
jgi:RNA polymerase sigma-70 factor (ECF subfamily)